MACVQAGTGAQGGDDNATPATGNAQSPIVYCPDFSQELAFNDAPFTSIGYLNNGCTATLIDPWHILAAAHCFVWDTEGEWQTGLNFYPQFDPNNANPRRYTVDRAVVGTRVLTGSGYLPSDWGIGHLACNGAFCPPALEPSLPILSTSIFQPLVFAGYPRDSLVLDGSNGTDNYCLRAPYADEARHSLAPPDQCCQWLPHAPGPPAPDPYCPAGNPNCWCDSTSNTWWNHGFVDPFCLLNNKDPDRLVLETGCSSRGGNSGSPFTHRVENQWFIGGVCHGGGFQYDTELCSNDAQRDGATGPAAERFQFAPRRAANVALARHASGQALTQVWITDSDSPSPAIRTRYRKCPLGFICLDTDPFVPFTSRCMQSQSCVAGAPTARSRACGLTRAHGDPRAQGSTLLECTRKHLLEVAASLQIPVRIATLTRGDLETAGLPAEMPWEEPEQPPKRSAGLGK